MSSTGDVVALFGELSLFLAEFCRELDNDGLDVTRFYLEDGVFAVGGTEHRGHAGVRGFYADRLARVRRAQQDGIRTTRHSFVNLHVVPDGSDGARLTFINLTYSGDGAPPITGLTGPAVVSDCRMACRRAGDGGWRIARFEGSAVFIGSDPLMNQMALPK